MLNPKPIVGYLIIKNHASLKDKLPIYEGQNIIGRVIQKSTIIIKDSQISSAHAKIKITNDKIILTDMGSKNGTFTNLDTKQRLQKGVPTQIQEGQTLAFGQVQCVVERTPVNRKSTKTPQKSKQEQSNKPGVLFELQQSSQAYLKNKNQKPVEQESNKSVNIFAQKYRKNDPKMVRIKKESVYLRTSESQLSQSEQLQIPKKKIDSQQQQKNPKETKNNKIAKQKQQKQRLLKEKKIQLQKAKKERQKLSKKQLQQLRKKQEQQKVQRQKERQERKRIVQQQQRQERQQQQKAQMQAKKKEQSKKLKQKTDQENKKKDKRSKAIPKDKESSKGKQQKSSKQISLQAKKTKNQSKQKQAKKGSKQQKQQTKEQRKSSKNKKMMKKGGKQVLQIQRESSQEKSENQRKSTSRQTKKKDGAIKTRKRVPNNLRDQNQNQNSKVYRTRQRLLKVTKFMVSGEPITFKTSPILQPVKSIDEDFDVLVMDSFKRTFKLLFSIVRGIPIVQKSWLSDSEYAKKPMQFDNYWISCPSDKNLIKESVQKAKQGFRVLNDLKFFIACQDEKLHIPFESLERLIYAAGGQVKRSLKTVKGNKSLCKEIIILLDQNYNDEELSTAKEINKENVYLVELVLQACLTQELELSKYKVKL